jgi:hypothetical protein
LLSAFEVQRQSDEAEYLIAPRRIGVGRGIEQLTDEPRDRRSSSAMSLPALSE